MTEGAGTVTRTRRGSNAAPLALATCTLLVVLAAILLLRHGQVALTADSVAQQSIVQTWLRVGHGQTYLPPDTWILKLPVYALFESLPLSPQTRLLAETFTLNAAGFVLVAFAFWQLAGQVGFARRWFDAALPLAWLATVGGGMGQYLSVMPNSRNIELGLSFLVIALAGRYLGQKPAPVDSAPVEPAAAHRPVRRWLPGVGVAVVLGLLWVDDPYFAFLVGLPLMLACLAWYRLKAPDARLLRLSAVLAGSLVAIPVLRWLLEGIGIHVVPDATGPTFWPGDLARHVLILWPSLSAQLGLSEDGPGTLVAHVLALMVLACGVAASAYVAVRSWRAGQFALTFIASHWPVVVAGVLANRTIYDFHAGRYLVLALFDLAVSLGLAAAALRTPRPRMAAAITGMLIAAVAANGAAAMLARSDPPPEVAQQREVLQALRGTGATKGYAEYWAANLYTHLSAGNLAVSDVSCENRRLRLRHWLTDTARVRVSASRTFVLFDPAASGFRGCSLADVETQLGPASTRVPVARDAVVLVYDRDITSRLDPAPTDP